MVVVYVGTNGLYIEERVALTENHEACYRKVLASPLTLVVTRGRWDHDLIPSPIFDIHTSYILHPTSIHPYIHPSHNLFIIRRRRPAVSLRGLTGIDGISATGQCSGILYECKKSRDMQVIPTNNSINSAGLRLGLRIGDEHRAVIASSTKHRENDDEELSIFFSRTYLSRSDVPPVVHNYLTDVPN